MANWQMCELVSDSVTPGVRDKVLRDDRGGSHVRAAICAASQQLTCALIWPAGRHARAPPEQKRQKHAKSADCVGPSSAAAETDRRGKTAAPSCTFSRSP
jgi:hypothetical protein